MYIVVTKVVPTKKMPPLTLGCDVRTEDESEGEGEDKDGDGVGGDGD